MPKYRLLISFDPVEFHSDTPATVLGVWRDMFFGAPTDPDEWRRMAALLASDWSGKPIRYHNDNVFIWDMMEHGMLEEVHEKG